MTRRSVEGSASALSIRGVCKSFGSGSVLADIDLAVGEGEIVSLVGPSGCGKSTLLRIVAGLEQADRGTVQIGARDVSGLPPGARNVAMVFQSLALYPHLTGRQNIALPLRARRLTRLQRLLGPLRLSASVRSIEREIDGAVDDIAARLDIGGVIDRVPARLSGGQRQRVAIGRALVRDSRLLLLDEPLSSLDAKVRVQARDEIVQIQRAFGVACVFVTHDQGEALAISDRVAVMLGGRVAQFGTPAEIYRNPVSLAVARFVGTPTINVLDGATDAAGRVHAAGFVFDVRLSASAGQAVSVAIRPEQVRIAGGQDDSRPLLRVARIEDHGHDGLVHLAGRDGNAVVLVARASRALAFQPGDEVCVSISADDALYFAEDGSRLAGLPVAMAA
ncbi:ABC transporter ATP-binding protein [Reyranella sp.]|uniref:ABC transporter ATP-binding protein n=1 Tax=Reyranella sp. TaxID=1929291 RepID=UPI0040354774